MSAACRDFEAAVAAVLRPVLFPRARLVLGLSGGLDSAVLLEVLRRLAAPLDFRLSCVHVHHGISPNAAGWAAFCARRCRRLGIALAVCEVDIRAYRAEGVEAAARRARYAVYARQEADFVVLAQHQDDQAETLLLQLLRGAGVKGGAAMPLLRRPGAVGTPAILRPMLALPRGRIERYARARRLKWVEDESNADTRYDRNFLRHRVLPVLEQGFPAFRATLARAAGHFAEAGVLLDELAAADAKGVVDGSRLDLAGLKAIGAARAKNLLRWWLLRAGAVVAEADHLEEALRQLLRARDDAAVRIALADRELRRYDGRAYLLRALPPLPRQWQRDWKGAGALPLPELGGALRFNRRKGGGLDCARVAGQRLRLCLRQGGETLRLRAGGSTRSLKNLLQEARMPPWERERLPLVYCGDELVAVPGIGVAQGWQASAGETGWRISWRMED